MAEMLRYYEKLCGQSGVAFTPLRRCTLMYVVAGKIEVRFVMPGIEENKDR